MHVGSKTIRKIDYGHGRAKLLVRLNICEHDVSVGVPGGALQSFGAADSQGRFFHT